MANCGRLHQLQQPGAKSKRKDVAAEVDECRTIDEWKIRPDHADKHWFDCLVGAAVAESIHGAVQHGTGSASERQEGRLKHSELQRRKR